jgi:hypothetical protein
MKGLFMCFLVLLFVASQAAIDGGSGVHYEEVDTPAEEFSSPSLDTQLTQVPFGDTWLGKHRKVTGHYYGDYKYRAAANFLRKMNKAKKHNHRSPAHDEKCNKKQKARYMKDMRKAYKNWMEAARRYRSKLGGRRAQMERARKRKAKAVRRERNVKGRAAARAERAAKKRATELRGKEKSRKAKARAERKKGQEKLSKRNARVLASARASGAGPFCARVRSV